MYTDPDPQFLAPARSLEIGQECPVFQCANLATLLIKGILYALLVGKLGWTFYYLLASKICYTVMFIPIP